MHKDEFCLNSDKMHSDMLTKLLLFILIHRDQPVSVETIADALWDEDETDNPAGALKNLMYRLRTILNKTFGKEEYILTSRGVYYWNPEMKVSLDAEEFEQLCEKAKKEKNSSKQILALEKAIALYQGEFMSRIIDRHWVMTLSTYYHSMMISTVKTLSSLYMQEERYEDVEQLCNDTLEIDPVDEWIHCTLITALMRQNKNKLAIQQYHEADKVLYDALGVRNSKQLNEIHEQLMNTNQGSETEKIQNIHKDMTEEKEPDGPYLCGYPVFREIYRLESRRISRLGESEYIILFTLEMKEKNISGSQKKMSEFIIQKSMKQLEKSILDTLRVGDVAARYSDSQFVILLPTCTYESCIQVSKRILNHFSKNDKNGRVEVITDYEEVSDAMQLIER